MTDFLGGLVYSFFSVLRDGLNAVIDTFDIDPFPDMISGINLSGSAVSRALGWINALVPLDFFVTSTAAFLAILALAWLAMTVWDWLNLGGV